VLILLELFYRVKASLRRTPVLPQVIATAVAFLAILVVCIETSAIIMIMGYSQGWHVYILEFFVREKG
jgi:hypothetical protein